MRSSVRLGRVAGIPVGAHWSLLVVAGLLTFVLATSLLPAAVPDAGGSASASHWVAAIAAAAAFFASVLAHELAHALVARRHGQRVEDITLWLLGGVARLGSEAPSPRVELRVALAGPVASLGIGVASLGAAWTAASLGAGDLLVVVLTWLGLVNGVLAVFNLLPGAPLDGGRVLAAVLWMRHGDRSRAQVGAARAGRLLGWGLVGLAVADVVLGVGVGTLWTALVGWFIVSASQAEEQAARLRGALEAVTVREVMDPYPEVVAGGSSAGELAATHPPWGPEVVLLQGADGDIEGILHVRDARRAARHDPDRPLRALGVSKAALTTARPGEPVAPIVFGGRLREHPVVVLDDGRVVGLLGATEVEAQLRDLARHAPSGR